MEQQLNDLRYILENHKHRGYDGTKTLNQTDTVVTLVDGATVDLNASQGSVFYLSAGGDRTINTPTSATAGKKIIIRHYANGANRTLTLSSGFRFGTDVTGLTTTTSGKMDYIGCIYNEIDEVWDVVALSTGY